ncbi:MAG: hypothetical protein ACLTYW_09020 [Collinsella sp.]
MASGTRLTRCWRAHELLEMACDEQVVLLVDGYDAAWLGRTSARRFRADGGLLIACCLTPLLRGRSLRWRA